MTDISEWSIVMAAGKSFVGHLTGNGVLRPAYELQAGIVPAPNGQIARMLMAAPVLGFASMDQLTLPSQGCVVHPVSALSREEAKDLAGAVSQAENIVQAMRAKSSGLVIAGANDLPGGRR